MDSKRLYRIWVLINETQISDRYALEVFDEYSLNSCGTRLGTQFFTRSGGMQQRERQYPVHFPQWGSDTYSVGDVHALRFAIRQWQLVQQWFAVFINRR